MKYSVKQLPSGEYAVGSGKSYFTSTVTIDKSVAAKIAAEFSARWYQEQMDNCKEEWIKAREALGEDISLSDFEWGDVLA